MKVLFAVVALVLAVNALSEKSQWESFKVKHGKSYRNAAEENYRFSVFVNNVKTIEEHNAKYEAGLSTYTMGVNQFADLTDDEFQERLGYQKASMPQIDATLHEFSGSSAAPDSIDWREEGAVLPIKDQGGCGSCWAFSATGALEGQNYIINQESVSLSEQELVDCSTDYGNDDCIRGGEMIYAFNYVADHGIQAEDDYPYDEDKLACRSNDDKKVLKIQGYKNISQSEDALKEAVGTIGPISITIYATPLKFYAGGIFSEECVSNATLLNHGVVAVGYGEHRDQPFWLIRNSWGEYWGEDGYLRLKRGNDLCGISLAASYPVL